MNCILYKNTGINAVNIPDSPASLVSWGTVIKTTAVDCMQSRFLQSVTVSTTWADIRDVDYVCVDDFYYFVTGVNMASYDVAIISLTPDFITSAGGPAALEILDGITERHHVPLASDTFGAYEEADSLISPSKVLKVAYTDMLFENSQSNYITLCESSIDLVEMGSASHTNEAITYEDATTTETVTVPKTTPVSSRTTFRVLGTGSYTTETNGTCLFSVDDASGQVKNGLQVVRDLGVENAVVAQYTLPASLFQAPSVNNGYVTAVTGVDTSESLGSASNFAFEYAQPRNKRLLYGECNKYGLLAASGNTAEFNPEDIYNNGSAPSVIYRGDPRANGCPYFAYDYFHGSSVSGNLARFFMNAVQGQEWRNLPLTYVTKSGSVQDAYHFASQRASASSAYNYNQNAYLLQQAGVLFGVGSGAVKGQANIAQTAAGNGRSASIADYRNAVNNAALGGGLNVIGTGITMAGNEYANRQYIDQYRIQAGREMFDFGVSQNVVAPTIMFPFQTPSVRDYAGNGVIAYRYYLDSDDITRIDRLLTAYGYRHTTPLNTTFFNNRPHFNYVKANGVSIGGDLPNWWKTGIADQFANGVRIWHVKPSNTYYVQNE